MILDRYTMFILAELDIQFLQNRFQFLAVVLFAHLYPQFHILFQSLLPNFVRINRIKPIYFFIYLCEASYVTFLTHKLLVTYLSDLANQTRILLIWLLTYGHSHLTFDLVTDTAIWLLTILWSYLTFDYYGQLFTIDLIYGHSYLTARIFI